ncbi:hypothetical protein [Sphingobium chungbukense]|uniref:Uncharacterized protein n=1 Tax=Sphingobium chungbukense TaxID=56193 RepID=A0A0M3AWZ2_9SPHN|nr:hypothetical protein [Sphingobium chungbukense]KKW93109.1 hypothetical protein YP76_05735 [Sphingobium chungbukense]
MRKLTKLVHGLKKAGTESQGNSNSGASVIEDSEDQSGGLTLEDRELIGFIETLDKRLASLEHDLWIARRQMAELIDNEGHK